MRLRNLSGIIIIDFIDMVSEEANIIVGTAVDDNLKDEIKVTLIATGLNGDQRRASQIKTAPRFSAAPSDNAPRRSTPAFTPQTGDENDIFSRKLKPGMSNIDVPSFFKKQ